jgi:ribosomal protein S18 acetylase RimI-like enzyme
MDFRNRAFQLRPVRTDDFQFVWSLYRDLMKPLTVELLGRWNEIGQKQVVEVALTQPGTFIIAKGELNIGWMQVVETPNTIYLGQLYVTPSSQNRGIGTAILRELTDRARREGKTLTLDVMKNNRSRALYERLGFRGIGQSEYKLKMQWQDCPEEADNERPR